MKNTKKKTIIIGLLALVVCLGIGFAAFSTTLKINGSAKVSPDESNYKVLFVSSVNSVTNYDRSDFDGIASSDEVDPGEGHFEDDTTFTEDGQSVDYKFYILNAGKYDAHITNLDIGKKTCTPGEDADPALAASACSSINLSVILGDEDNQTTYTSSQAISDHILPKGTWEQIIVRITYPEGSPLVDGELDVTWKDISFLTATSASYAPPAPKTYNVGDEFCIDTECFFVIDNDEETVTALAKHSLYAGWVYNGYNDEEFLIDNSNPKYSLQKKDIGEWHNYDYYMELYDGDSNKCIDCFIVEGINTYYGPRETYLERGYWAEEDGSLNPKYGTNYPAYVYDENSNLYPYLNYYEDYLINKLNKKSVTVSLLNLKQIEKLGCELQSENEYYCDNNKIFDNISQYWLGTAADYRSVYQVDGQYIYPEEAVGEYSIQIRPVITISKIDI